GSMRLCTRRSSDRETNRRRVRCSAPAPQNWLAAAGKLDRSDSSPAEQQRTADRAADRWRDCSWEIAEDYPGRPVATEISNSIRPAANSVHRTCRGPVRSRSQTIFHRDRTQSRTSFGCLEQKCNPRFAASRNRSSEKDSRHSPATEIFSQSTERRAHSDT